MAKRPVYYTGPGSAAQDLPNYGTEHDCPAAYFFALDQLAHDCGEPLVTFTLRQGALLPKAFVDSIIGLPASTEVAELIQLFTILVTPSSVAPLAFRYLYIAPKKEETVQDFVGRAFRRASAMDPHAKVGRAPKAALYMLLARTFPNEMSLALAKKISDDSVSIQDFIAGLEGKRMPTVGGVPTMAELLDAAPEPTTVHRGKDANGSKPNNSRHRQNNSHTAQAHPRSASGTASSTQNNFVGVALAPDAMSPTRATTTKKNKANCTYCSHAVPNPNLSHNINGCSFVSDYGTLGTYLSSGFQLLGPNAPQFKSNWFVQPIANLSRLVTHLNPLPDTNPVRKLAPVVRMTGVVKGLKATLNYYRNVDQQHADEAGRVLVASLLKHSTTLHGFFNVPAAAEGIRKHAAENGSHPAGERLRELSRAGLAARNGGSSPGKEPEPGNGAAIHVVAAGSGELLGQEQLAVTTKVFGLMALSEAGKDGDEMDVDSEDGAADAAQPTSPSNDQRG
ncbi:hypothetical protein BCR44DRAFT_347153 [Catenaria anguillulae PL171]|uniref:Uncharacterized protein n=1 Tax=Catenaria anguillulae PL171 TaxID=765915 RepID=A0A1Y2H7H0_9FUNG|nr:hypothetical protein BCR44DRAFT_347153 [Catenaria anguillulae PL171]